MPFWLKRFRQFHKRYAVLSDVYTTLTCYTNFMPTIHPSFDRFNIINRRGFPTVGNNAGAVTGTSTVHDIQTKVLTNIRIRGKYGRQIVQSMQNITTRSTGVDHRPQFSETREPSPFRFSHQRPGGNCRASFVEQFAEKSAADL